MQKFLLVILLSVSFGCSHTNKNRDPRSVAGVGDVGSVDNKLDPSEDFHRSHWRAVDCKLSLETFATMMVLPEKIFADRKIEADSIKIDLGQGSKDKNLYRPGYEESYQLLKDMIAKKSQMSSIQLIRSLQHNPDVQKCSLKKPTGPVSSIFEGLDRDGNKERIYTLDQIYGLSLSAEQIVADDSRSGQLAYNIFTTLRTIFWEIGNRASRYVTWSEDLERTKDVRQSQNPMGYTLSFQFIDKPSQRLAVAEIIPDDQKADLLFEDVVLNAFPPKEQMGLGGSASYGRSIFDFMVGETAREKSIITAVTPCMKSFQPSLSDSDDLLKQKMLTHFLEKCSRVESDLVIFVPKRIYRLPKYSFKTVQPSQLSAQSGINELIDISQNGQPTNRVSDALIYKGFLELLDIPHDYEIVFEGDLVISDRAAFESSATQGLKRYFGSRVDVNKKVKELLMAFQDADSGKLLSEGGFQVLAALLEKNPETARFSLGYSESRGFSVVSLVTTKTELIKATEIMNENKHKLSKPVAHMIANIAYAVGQCSKTTEILEDSLMKIADVKMNNGARVSLKRVEKVLDSTFKDTGSICKKMFYLRVKRNIANAKK